MPRSRSFTTITVGELLDLLQGEDPKALVAFTSSYGDLANTPQAHPLSGEVEERRIIPETAYSNSGWAIAPDSEDEDGIPVLFLL